VSSKTNSQGDFGVFRQILVENPGCDAKLDQGRNAFADVTGMLDFGS
jgi:hypothetical protein